jgi:hypothetical protein
MHGRVTGFEGPFVFTDGLDAFTSTAGNAAHHVDGTARHAVLRRPPDGTRSCGYSVTAPGRHAVRSSAVRTRCSPSMARTG